MPLRGAEGIEVLADPTRRRIIALLAARVWHPADIAAAIGRSRPAVSRQLRLLVESGLVRWRWSVIDGRSRDYFIDPAMREPIIAWLAGVDLRGVRPIVRLDWSPPLASTAFATTRARCASTATKASASIRRDRSKTVSPVRRLVSIVPLRWNHLESRPGGD